VKVYAVVSFHVQIIIEVFPTRDEAEGFIEEVREDEPELAAMLGVEAIEPDERSRSRLESTMELCNPVISLFG
jgi:hypothetical protein